jgi:hypothetical protein
MSLSAWEQDALDSIKNGLADSDPALVARLVMFTRLASAEDMPVREKIQAVKLGVARRRRRLYQRLGVGRAMLLVWLVTTLTLITAAVASSRASGPRHVRRILGIAVRSRGRRAPGGRSDSLTGVSRAVPATRRKAVSDPGRRAP